MLKRRIGEQAFFAYLFLFPWCEWPARIVSAPVVLWISNDSSSLRLSMDCLDFLICACMQIMQKLLKSCIGEHICVYLVFS